MPAPDGKAGNQQTTFCLQKNEACNRGKNGRQTCQLTRSPDIGTSSRSTRKHGTTVFCLQKKSQATCRGHSDVAGRTDRVAGKAQAFRLHANVDFAQPPVCLQEEHDATLVSTAAVHDCTLSENANNGRGNGPSLSNALSGGENGLYRTSDGLKTGTAVEKRLHIHRTGCAESALCTLRDFLSNIGAALVQDFSSILE